MKSKFIKYSEVGWIWIIQVNKNEVIKMDCPYVEGSSPYLVLLYSSIFRVRESKYSRFESYELKLEIFV